MSQTCHHVPEAWSIPFTVSGSAVVWGEGLVLTQPASEANDPLARLSSPFAGDGTR
jgi:hypothetical protein